jgi:hypothetical protein
LQDRGVGWKWPLPLLFYKPVSNAEIYLAENIGPNKEKLNRHISGMGIMKLGVI